MGDPLKDLANQVRNDAKNQEGNIAKQALKKVGKEILKVSLPILPYLVIFILSIVLLAGIFGINEEGLEEEGLEEVGYIQIGDDYIVNTSMPNSSYVVRNKNELARALERVYSGEQLTNLLRVNDNGTFLELQNRYNVNAVFAIAVCEIESSCGTNWAAIPPDTYNWMSVQGSYNGNSYTTPNGFTWRVYSSFDEATLDFGNLIANSIFYFQANKNTVKEIAPTYCSEYWGTCIVSSMTRIYNALGIVPQTTIGGDILSVCQEVTAEFIDRGVHYSDEYNDLIWGDIERCYNESRYICCATYVSMVIYKSGLLSVDHINRYFYHSTADDGSRPNLPSMLRDAGWRLIDYSEIRPGDVINKVNSHVLIYAGNGRCWDQTSCTIPASGATVYRTEEYIRSSQIWRAP